MNSGSMELTETIQASFDASAWRIQWVHSVRVLECIVFMFYRAILIITFTLVQLQVLRSSLQNIAKVRLFGKTLTG